MREDDREDAVLEGIFEEDIAEGRRDPRAEACARERPDRALARRSAAEVLRGDEDLRIAILGAIEHEGGIGLAQVVEEEFLVAGGARLAQESRGNDAVGVDV